jgi:uncharacterized protein YneF (UPF0154 family)
MIWYIIASLVVGFVAGFFVGGKHEKRLMEDVGKIKDLGRKL